MTREEKINQFLNQLEKENGKHTPTGAIYGERIHVAKWTEDGEPRITPEEFKKWDDERKANKRR